MQVLDLKFATTAPARRFSDRRHVFDLKLQQPPELRQPRNPGADRRFVAINRKLRYTGPSQRLVPAQEGLADVTALAADLRALRTGRAFRDGRHVVCSESS
jgi:hypothetical protein